MKKLLSLLGATGLLLAAGSSVMSFSYVNQPVSTTTVVNSTLAEAKNINEIITTTNLGVVGNLDGRLVAEGEWDPYFYWMRDADLIAFIAESNPILNSEEFQGRVHIEDNAWNQRQRLSTNKISIEGVEGTINVTFKVPNGTPNVILQPQLGAFVTRKQDGTRVKVTTDMIVDRIIALNRENLPKNITRSMMHYRQLPIFDGTYGEITIDNFSSRMVTTWDAVRIPSVINTDLKVSEVSEAAIVAQFEEMNPDLEDLFYSPTTASVSFINDHTASINFHVGKDVVLIAVVYYELV